MDGSGNGRMIAEEPWCMCRSRARFWWAEADDKRRPVLVVTRNEAISVFSSIVVAPPLAFVRR